MAPRVESIIEQFDGSSDLASRIVREITADSLFEFLGSEHRIVKARLAALLKEHLREAAFRQRVTEQLDRSRHAAGDLLEALSCSPLQQDGLVFEAVREHLESADGRAREQAARVIAYQYPERAGCLSACLHRHGTLELAKILCYSANADLVFPVYEFLRKQRTAAKHKSPILGLLLNPFWLAEHFAARPELVSELAFEYGYAPSAEVETLIPFFARGFYFATPQMAAAPRWNAWQSRIGQYARALLPDYLCESRRAYAVLSEDSIDQALFIAAAREQDVANLEQRKTENPYSWHQRENVSAASLYHSPYTYCSRRLIDESLRLAQELGVSQGHLPEFLIERARIVLETDEERKAEADLTLRSKWVAMSRIARPTQAMLTQRYPIQEDRDFPLLKFAVLKADLPAKRAHTSLSPGASAILNICDYLGLDGRSDDLVAVERAQAQFLLPIGCEAQIVAVPRHCATAWKQALRYFGVPSPRRLEYKNMVEASFRPSLTYHAQVLGPMLLLRLGLIAEERDYAFHVSVAGELGPEAKYLVFPMLFQRQKQRPVAASLRYLRRARHMSKGFIHFNQDAESCGVRPLGGRTELRIIRLCVERGDDGQLCLNPKYIDELVAIHLLASALSSSDVGFHAAFKAYRNALNEYVATLPGAFSELLGASFFDATGDPQDGALVAKLPIIQKMEAAWRATAEMSEYGNLAAAAKRLEEDLSALFYRHAKLAYEALSCASQAAAQPDSSPRTSFGVPFFVPGRCMTAPLP